jgi:hypothetical protein
MAIAFGLLSEKYNFKYRCAYRTAKEKLCFAAKKWRNWAIP